MLMWPSGSGSAEPLRATDCLECSCRFSFEITRHRLQDHVDHMPPWQSPRVVLPSCASGGRRPGFKNPNQENTRCLPSHSWHRPRRPRRRCFSVAFQPEAK